MRKQNDYKGEQPVSCRTVCTVPFYCYTELYCPFSSFVNFASQTVYTVPPCSPRRYKDPGLRRCSFVNDTTVRSAVLQAIPFSFYTELYCTFSSTFQPRVFVWTLVGLRWKRIFVFFRNLYLILQIFVSHTCISYSSLLGFCTAVCLTVLYCILSYCQGSPQL